MEGSEGRGDVGFGPERAGLPPAGTRPLTASGGMPSYEPLPPSGALGRDVGGAVGALEDEIENLVSEVAALEERLSTALVPDMPSPDGTVRAVEVPEPNDLRRLTARLRLTRVRLERIRGRVDL